MQGLEFSRNLLRLNKKVEILGDRYSTIDSLRGLALINMILYHLCYDLVFIFGADMPWFYSKGAYYWQQLICGTFIFLMGMSSYLSSRNVNRGIKIFLCGMIITVSTTLFIPSEAIYFGILHFSGLCCIIFGLCKKYLDKLNEYIGISICTILFIITKKIYEGYLVVFNYKIVKLNPELYKADWFAPLGFPTSNFTSSDYFPLMPWLFLALIGYFTMKLIIKGDNHKILAVFNIKVLNFMGKNSLLIYIVHQPIIYIILLVIFK